MSKFLDEALVTFESGKGGDGSASFHREKYVPLGGPNGADGGRGGDVTLVADRHLRTLYGLRQRKVYRGGAGVDAINNRGGKHGESVTVKVPVGTVVTDVDLHEVLVDLHVDGMRYDVCIGGKGGFGNLHFTTSVRQAPTIAQHGAPGEVVNAKLEMKLIADVGLVGLPNAGKSTLLSALSAARPKIAEYPFTTITPNLGVVAAGDGTFVMADLPGLIEGASEGLGLGHQFLKHAERNRVLIHVVDGFPIDGSDPVENYRTVEKELGLYSEELSGSRRLTVVNKIDVATDEDAQSVLERFRNAGVEALLISGVSGAGTQELVFQVAGLLEEALADEPMHVVVPVVRRKMSPIWDAERLEDGTYVVTGARIERLIHMTKLDNHEALGYLHQKLERIGVLGRLRDLGVEFGDTVRIGEFEFEYRD